MTKEEADRIDLLACRMMEIDSRVTGLISMLEVAPMAKNLRNYIKVEIMDALVDYGYISKELRRSTEPVKKASAQLNKEMGPPAFGQEGM